jgi:tRNA1(Val) A37 N6-methylase TrmN6
MPASGMSFAPMRLEAATTEDAVLGGRLTLRQPQRGHRVGHDAMLLAAATDAHPGEHAVDLGAGVGGAGLALARRVDGLTVTLVELDPVLAALAAENAARNGLAGRVCAVALDVTAFDRAFSAVGLESGIAAHVLMNPPYLDAARQNLSPDPQRRTAHAALPGALPQWMRRAAWLLAPGGMLTLIWRADGLPDVLAQAAEHFGALAVLPIFPRPGAPAIRVLVRGRKASRAPLTLLSGLTLNGADGRPSGEAEAILRGGKALAWPSG